MSRQVPFPKWLAVPAVDWAPDGATLSPVCRYVLGVFVNEWTEHGKAEIRMGVPVLVGRTGFSERAVISARQELTERGLLRLIDAGGRGRGSCATFALGGWADAAKGATAAPKDYSRARLAKGAPAAPIHTERVHGVQSNEPRKGARKGAQTRADIEREIPPAPEGREGMWDDVSEPLPNQGAA